MNELPTESEPVKVVAADAFTFLRGLPDGCVQTCVTSPPYYGLRDYGTGTWEGGEDECDHRSTTVSRQEKSRASSTLNGSVETCHASHVARHLCPKCGAIRIDRQIGLESSPEAFVARLVDVFREVRRALADDGTAWVNMGDSYAASGMGGNPEESEFRKQATNSGSLIPGRKAPNGMKPKDLIGTPWMLAFALRADGWYLRQDIIWSKPNTMPESVTDRCTKAHEYLFLLSKSDRYYFDADAIAPPAAEASYARLAQDVESQQGSFRANGGAKTNGAMKAVSKGGGASFGKQNHDANGTGSQSRVYDRPAYLTRNSRSVWWVATESYHDAHFAVMPRKLVEPCILAGSRPGDIVLDPFVGSGTTLAVAMELGRRGIGCDLNPAYVTLAEERLARVTPSLFEVA